MVFVGFGSYRILFRTILINQCPLLCLAQRKNRELCDTHNTAYPQGLAFFVVRKKKCFDEINGVKFDFRANPVHLKHIPFASVTSNGSRIRFTDRGGRGWEGVRLRERLQSGGGGEGIKAQCVKPLYIGFVSVTQSERLSQNLFTRYSLKIPTPNQQLPNSTVCLRLT